MNIRSCVLTVLTVGSGLTASAPALAARYIFTDVGIGCCSTSIAGINDRGVVVGRYSPSTDGNFISFRSSVAGKSRVIGAAEQLFVAVGPTDTGLVAGTSQNTGVAYLVEIATGATRVLSAPGPFTINPAAISVAGVVVGLATDKSFNYHGYRYDSGKAELLDFPGGNSTTADAVNRFGQVAGSYKVGQTQQYGYVLTNGRYRSFVVPASLSLQVGAIDPNGRVVGYYHDTNQVVRGFLLENGVVTRIDDPGERSTELFGFGPGGELFGEIFDPSINATAHGIIYSRGKFTRIDDPKASPVGTFISGVNASGTIVGEYADGNGFGHGYVATCPAAAAPCD